jgi:hypothetical protein
LPLLSGRGREGGELGILSDLGLVHLLNDRALDIKGVRFCGISWKSDLNQFKLALAKREDEPNTCILLIHQFMI